MCLLAWLYPANGEYAFIRYGVMNTIPTFVVEIKGGLFWFVIAGPSHGLATYAATAGCFLYLVCFLLFANVAFVNSVFTNVVFSNV